MIATAIVDARKKEQTMSVLDKLDLLTERREEFNGYLAKRADALLDRYAKARDKADRGFDKHDARLDAEEQKFDATAAAIDRMANVGNSPGSETSSEKPNATGGVANTNTALLTAGNALPKS